MRKRCKHCKTFKWRPSEYISGNGIVYPTWTCGGCMQTPSTELGIFIFVETYRTYGKFYDYEDAAEFCNHVEHIHEVKP